MNKIVTLTLNPALDMIVELPSLVPEAVNKARGGRTFCGGKGINVSLVLSLSGVKTDACGFLGDGNAGQFRRFCAEQGIGFEFDLLPGATRTNVKLAVDGRGATDINLPGLSPDASSLKRLEERVLRLLAPGDWLALSGSLPPGVDAGVYARLIGRARAVGAKTALDASGPALAAGLAAGPDLAKPNQHELLEVEGKRDGDMAAVVALARRWLSRGVGTMAVSLGSEGAMLLRNDVSFRAAPAPVKAINMVGAGDTFLAGMLHASLREWPADRCLAYAVALSGHWVEKMERARLDPGRVETLSREVRVTPLE